MVLLALSYWLFSSCTDGFGNDISIENDYWFAKPARQLHSNEEISKSALAPLLSLSLCDFFKTGARAIE
ncbi:hypothetical protein [Chlorogloeopsis sp. ULAP02]|uniref:hypothetical protein n=1 Tax=Chlorogloeopsis sp. ULAP02 TaxID=3107926 RepID=UPI00398ADBA3